MRVAPVGNYQLDLSETVPYIGAATVQAKGVTGRGIKVAVLDSGIDYLHADLGGSAIRPISRANDPTIIESGHSRRAKVVGGYDFTGSDWPNARKHPIPIRSTPAWAAGTARTWPTSLPARRASRPVRRSMRSRSAPRSAQLLRHRADPGHGICGQSQRRRPAERPRRRHQHVARLALRPTVRRRSLGCGRQRDDGRCTHRRVGRQQRRQALCERHAGRREFGAVGRADLRYRARSRHRCGSWHPAALPDYSRPCSSLGRRR